MHDGVAQTLFYLGTNLREVRALPEVGSEGEALDGVRAAELHLGEAHARVREAIADSR
jgi:signal transduction histidine kinase